ncbi:hypothetical protein ACLK19_08135 [Escherichia coli]
MDNPHQTKYLTHHQHRTGCIPTARGFKMEKILACASKAAGDNAMANQYETLANARQKAIETCGTINKAGMPITT